MEELPDDDIHVSKHVTEELPVDDRYVSKHVETVEKIINY
jgi:hypothetical protein